jgi:hypothetical protein
VGIFYGVTMLPLFIEVSIYPSVEEDNNTKINLNQEKRATIPLSWIGPFIEESFSLDSGKQLEATLMTLQYGQKVVIKEHYETVKEKINQCLPDHLKKESWQSDDPETQY